MTEFGLNPATYADLMRVEVPAYGRLQQEVGLATAELAVSSVLDLGTGTGETLASLLAHHRGAAAVGVDENEAMLGGSAAGVWPGYQFELRVADLTNPLPGGPFDLVVSALAIHHLDGPDKADLFARIAGVLRPGGRFVLGDVVIPVDRADVVIPITDGHDRPSTLADQLHWLGDAASTQPPPGPSAIWSCFVPTLRADFVPQEPSGTTTPFSYDHTTAWTRSRRSSFIRIRATWVLTVLSSTTRSAAISALDSPWATRRRTSRSRGVSVASCGWIAGSGRAARTNRAMSRRVIAGRSVRPRPRRCAPRRPAARWAHP